MLLLCCQARSSVVWVTINWRLGSKSPGWPASIGFMMPFTIFMVNICGCSYKSPSMSHSAPSMRWSAFRESNMRISQPFNLIEETDACKEVVCITSYSKSSESFLKYMADNRRCLLV